MTVLFLLFSILQAFGESSGLTSSETEQLTQKFGDRVHFVPNGRIDNFILVNVFTDEPNSLSSGIVSSVLLGTSDGTITDLSIEEKNVFSSRVVHSSVLGLTFVEVIGSTSMGNGNLYLFDSKKHILLSTEFYDSHLENEEYYIYHKVALFKDRKLNGEQLSRVFRDGKLNIQYDWDQSGHIRIYGFADFISEKDGEDSVILSLPIEEVFGYSRLQGRFIKEKNSGPVVFSWKE